MKPESNILSPIYFPFTVIDPSLLEALSGCFDRVTLYRPVGSPPIQGHGASSERFLETRIPFEDTVDKQALLAELQQWKRWGLMNQDADMAYLKAVQEKLAPADPVIPKIASEIRASGVTGREVGKGFCDSNLAPQLFLHLAQDYDERSVELREHIGRFKLQEKALQDFLRVDRPEEDDIPLPGAVFLDSNSDTGGFMIENRISAWNYLFQEDHEASAILVTDSSAAHAWLLEAARESLEPLKHAVPCIRQSGKEAPWNSCLIRILVALLTTEWSDPLRQELEMAGLELDDRIKAWDASGGPAGDSIARIRWSVVPGLAPCTLLQKRCGLPAEPKHPGCAKNCILGLVL
jgi:hypothetical protein